MDKHDGRTNRDSGGADRRVLPAQWHSEARSFGSVLSDRFSDASDIDVLVEFRPEHRVGFFRLADIEEELSSLFGGRKVDLHTPMDLSRYFREEVVRSALVIYAES